MQLQEGVHAKNVNNSLKIVKLDCSLEPTHCVSYASGMDSEPTSTPSTRSPKKAELYAAVVAVCTAVAAFFRAQDRSQEEAAYRVLTDAIQSLQQENTELRVYLREKERQEGHVVYEVAPVAVSPEPVAPLNFGPDPDPDAEPAADPEDLQHPWPLVSGATSAWPLLKTPRPKNPISTTTLRPLPSTTPAASTAPSAPTASAAASARYLVVSGNIAREPRLPPEPPRDRLPSWQELPAKQKKLHCRLTTYSGVVLYPHGVTRNPSRNRGAVA